MPLRVRSTGRRFIHKSISVLILTAFISTSVKVPIYAQVDPMPGMSQPGVMVHLSPEYTPAYLKGIVIHPENALKFDFIIYKGDRMLTEAQKREEYTKLTKYFLASLAIPDDDQWVNLSPYEKDRIIKDDFGRTEMGRDLLAQDYMLKQITASLIYPEDNLGKKFWDRVYAQAQEQYGTTNIPVNTFNKVWILPDNALIYEKGNTAYVLKNHLRVMLEEDYLSLAKHSGISSSVKRPNGGEIVNSGVIASAAKQSLSTLGSKIVREIVLPELQREVNEGKNFAALRQVYSGMLLAAWYKHALKESLLARIYANKAHVKGVDQDPKTNEEIYRQYLKAYKKGVFNFIKEDVDKYTNATIPRKYFSGGTTGYIEKDYAQVVHTVTAISGPQNSAMTAEINNNDYDLAQVAAEESDAAILISRRALLAGVAIIPAIAQARRHSLIEEYKENLKSRNSKVFGVAVQRLFLMGGNDAYKALDSLTGEKRVIASKALNYTSVNAPIDVSGPALKISSRDFGSARPALIFNNDLLPGYTDDLVHKSDVIERLINEGGDLTVLDFESKVVLKALQAYKGKLEEKDGLSDAQLLFDLGNREDVLARINAIYNITLRGTRGPLQNDAMKDYLYRAFIASTVVHFKGTEGMLQYAYRLLLNRSNAEAVERAFTSPDLQETDQMMGWDLAMRAQHYPFARDKFVSGPEAAAMLETVGISPKKKIFISGIREEIAFKFVVKSVYKYIYSVRLADWKDPSKGLIIINGHPDSLNAIPQATYSKPTIPFPFTFDKVEAGEVNMLTLKEIRDLLTMRPPPIGASAVKFYIAGTEVALTPEEVMELDLDPNTMFTLEPTTWNNAMLSVEEGKRQFEEKVLDAFPQLFPDRTDITTVLSGINDESDRGDFVKFLTLMHGRIAEVLVTKQSPQQHAAQKAITSIWKKYIKTRYDSAMRAEDWTYGGKFVPGYQVLDLLKKAAINPEKEIEVYGSIETSRVKFKELLKLLKGDRLSVGLLDKNNPSRGLVVLWMKAEIPNNMTRQFLQKIFTKPSISFVEIESDRLAQQRRETLEKLQKSGLHRIVVTIPGLRLPVSSERRMKMTIRLKTPKPFDMAQTTKYGGIDFNSANLHLQIKRDGNGVPLPISQQNLENIHIDGLIPVILRILPARASSILSQLTSSNPASV